MYGCISQVLEACSGEAVWYAAGDAANDGYDTPDEGENLDPQRMTIAQMKDYLTEHGHEDKAYALASKKAKKGDYVAIMEDVLGSPSRRH